MMSETIYYNNIVLSGCASIGYGTGRRREIFFLTEISKRVDLEAHLRRADTVCNFFFFFPLSLIRPSIYPSIISQQQQQHRVSLSSDSRVCVCVCILDRRKVRRQASNRNSSRPDGQIGRRRTRNDV